MDGLTREMVPRLIRDGSLIVGAIFAVYLFAVVAPGRGTFGFDAWAYHAATPPLYEDPPGAFGAFLYSPAFYQVTAPLRALSWIDFSWLWAGVNLASAIWLGQLALGFPLTWVEIYHGNIHLLMAVAIVLGFRYPAAWAFILLTKVTSGVGILWFVARGEWRNLAIVIGATGAIVLVSAIVDPGLWADYVGFLFRVVGTPSPLEFGPPLLVRLPIAAAIVVWGARTDRPWTVGVAVMLALPNLWWHGLAVLTAAFAVAGKGRSRIAGPMSPTP